MLFTLDKKALFSFFKLAFKKLSNALVKTIKLMLLYSIVFDKKDAQIVCQNMICHWNKTN